VSEPGWTADRIASVHTNGGPGPIRPFPMPDDERASLTDVEKDRVARIEAFMREEFGYIAIQSTRPQTAGTAAFVGYTHEPVWGVVQPNSRVPTAALVLAHDVAIRRYAETENTITRWTDVDRGGHFAALEEPELLLADVREFFRDLR
jgi:pimeloyl-ACP methyl ester carboxylesterase